LEAQIENSHKMEVSEQVLTQKQKSGMPVALRIFLYLIAVFLGSAIFQIIGILIAGIPLEEVASIGEMGVYVHLIMGLWGLVPLAFFTFIFRKYVDEKSIVSLGFEIKGRGRDMIAGLVVALLLIGGGSLLLKLFGYIEFEVSEVSFTVLALNFLFFIVVALSEEIMMRGYILNNLLSVINRYAALVITAFLFAGMHGLNDNLTWLSMLNLFLAGIILGATYIFTKNLWFPISLHLFWNFLQGPVLGYNVSGQTTESFLSVTQKGNELFTGGEFGFEGSIVCSILIVLFSMGIFVYYETKKPAKST
jgi:membrane protease YdiL (CAAX protease family)